MAVNSNYCIYHLHSDLSNAVTNIDSVTKFKEYIDRAKECGMNAMAFSEHGSVMEWWHKKCAIEDAGMKYIHAVEAYLTEDLTEKIRDNYHCVLIAKNYEGFLELNSLVSQSFNRKDNHFYYAPRISFDELFSTSDNILITTACVGGVFEKGSNETQKKFLEFMTKHKERCFFEVGHHLDDTTLIFQWESDSAQHYLKQFMSDQTLEIARSKIPNFSMLKWMSFGNGLLRPACASFRDSVARGEFYDNGFDALNEFLSPEAGRIAMQETIMQFLVKFCGYSAAESDNVRRAIAKKKGTETLLPEIEKRFIEYSSEHYDITKERCEEVIKPFLQIILDASAYGFSWNHSDAYSSIGYICGYLRYYYPLEFLTAALNIFGDNMDKTADITNYATKVGIRVTLPKWGLSRGEYFFDKEKKIIAKGLSSVKYMSAGLADELYELAKNKYTSFMDLLKDLDEKSSINSRQLDILIKLDFFSDFGNQRELLRMVDLFSNFFKKGQAKQIKKSDVDGTPIEDIIKRYAVGVTKSGGIAKSYTLLDISSILHEAEKAIRDMHLEDLSDLIKVRNFYDVMGYIGYVSGDEKDRRKLYITDLKPLFRKKDGKQFGYSVFTKSIGSGKESRFTVFNNVYNKEPVREGDIIFCKGYERDGQYFKLTAYSRVV